MYSFSALIYARFMYLGHLWIRTYVFPFFLLFSPFNSSRDNKTKIGRYRSACASASFMREIRSIVANNTRVNSGGRKFVWIFLHVPAPRSIILISSRWAAFVEKEVREKNSKIKEIKKKEINTVLELSSFPRNENSSYTFQKISVALLVRTSITSILPGSYCLGY